MGGQQDTLKLLGELKREIYNMSEVEEDTITRIGEELLEVEEALPKFFTDTRNLVQRIIHFLFRSRKGVEIIKSMIEKDKVLQVKIIYKDGVEVPYTVKVKPVDLMELMVMHRLAYDEKAREVFKKDFIEMLKFIYSHDEGGGELKALYELVMDGRVSLSEVVDYWSEKIDEVLDYYKKEMEKYEKGGDPDKDMKIIGDKLAYHVYVRRKLEKRGDIYAKLMLYIENSVIGATILTVADRSKIFEKVMSDLIKKEDLKEITDNAKSEIIEKHRDEINEKLTRVVIANSHLFQKFTLKDRITLGDIHEKLRETGRKSRSRENVEAVIQPA